MVGAYQKERRLGLAALVRQGAFDATNVIGGFAAVVPTSVGVWLGQKSRDALSPEMFRRVFLVGLLGIGLLALRRRRPGRKLESN